MYLIKGTTEVQLEDYEEAILYFETALERSPNTPILLAALADAHYAQGDEATALFYARKAKTNGPGRAYYYHQLADLQRQTDQPESALQTYQNLIARFPADTAAYRALAELQARMSRPNAALQTYDRFLEHTSHPPVSVYRKMLSLHRRLGNTDGIEQTLRVLVERRPNNSDYRRRLGNHYASTDQPEAALELLAPLAKQRPADTELQQRVDRLFRKTGRTAEAQPSPRDSGNGSSLSVDELVQRAEAAYEKATTRSAEIDSSRVRLAETLLKNALDRAPNHVDALSLQARLLTEQDAHAQAAQMLKRTLEENPRSPERWARAASAYLSAHDYDTAASVAEEGLLLFPGHLPLTRTAAVARMRSDAPDRALDLARRAVDQAPSDPLAHDTLGWVYLQRGNPVAAQRHLQRALEAGSPSARILEHAGDVEHALGNDDAARTYWRKALDRSPNRFSLQQKLDEASVQ